MRQNETLFRLIYHNIAVILALQWDRFIRGRLTTVPLDSWRSGRILSVTTPRWRNWQTHYFEVVAPQGVQVQILSWAHEDS